MKLYKIFAEIQNRTILTIFSWGFTLLISYKHKTNLLFMTLYFNANIYLDKNFYFITTDITDLLSSYLTLSYFFTNQFVMVYALYNITIFLAPGLYHFEYEKIKIKLKLIFFIICFCFILTNSTLIPTFWSFFGNYISTNNNVPVYFEAKITEYIHLYKFIYYSLVSICFVYLILYYTIHFFEQKLKLFKKLKKLTILMYFIIATITTPPDVLSQIFLGLFLIILNEILIFTIILKTKYKSDYIQRERL